MAHKIDKIYIEPTHLYFYPTTNHIFSVFTINNINWNNKTIFLTSKFPEKIEARGKFFVV